MKRVKGRWYVYIAVPKDVQAALGRKSFTETLHTGDFADARKRAPEVIKKIKLDIANARRGETIKKIDLAPARQAMSNWHSKGGLERTISDDWYDPIRVEKFKLAATTEDGWRQIPDYDNTLAQMLDFGGLAVASSDPLIAAFRQEAAFYLWIGEQHRERTRQDRKFEADRIAAIDRLSAVRRTDLTDIGPTFQPPPPPPPPSMKISALYKAWLASLKFTPTPKELQRFDHYVRRLTETLGDKPVNYVTKVEIQEFMDLVARYPGRKRTAVLEKLPMRALITKFEADNAKRIARGEQPIETLKEKSVGVWFANFNRMFEYAVAFDHIPRNPFAGLQKHTVKGMASVSRRAFSEDEIKAIFMTPLFQGFAGSGAVGYRDKPGSTVTKDAKYWLPILSLFHAGRLNEFAALRLANFKITEAGNRYFDLTVDVKVKNQTAERYVPLHPHLISLGFCDYVQELRDKSAVWLFPDLNHDTKHGPGHAFSKWWGSWSDKHGLSDPSIVYHSWRHTWKRRARETEGLKEEMHDVISGHKAPNRNVSDVARGYGAGAAIDALARDMGKISFPEFPALP